MIISLSFTKFTNLYAKVLEGNLLCDIFYSYTLYAMTLYKYFLMGCLELYVSVLHIIKPCGNRSPTGRPAVTKSAFCLSQDPGRIYKAAPHSNAVITMIYFGKNVHLSYEDTDFRDEIKIYQQHCGGENLCIYKGKLLEKGTNQCEF